MTEDEEHLKHCSLRRLVERPHQSVVEVHNSGKAEHDHDVTQDVAHGAPWVLDPAMLGYGSANVDETERRGVPQHQTPPHQGHCFWKRLLVLLLTWA
jgi:hypothetical protein